MVLFALPTLALAAAAVAAAVATDPMRSARARAADLAGRMTWEEKLGQLGGVRRLVDRVDGAPAFNATSFAEFAQTQNGQLGESRPVRGVKEARALGYLQWLTCT